SGLVQLLSWLLRYRPDDVHPGLEIPFNPFPRKNASHKRRETLSRVELNAVLSACRADIDTAWTLFCQGQEALALADRASIQAEPNPRRLDLNDLGVLIAVIVDRFGGVMPCQKQSLAKGKGLWPIHFACQARGGTNGFSRYLHATPETLVPFMIAIAAESFANPESLRNLRRDCMTEHLMLPDRVVVTWRKERSTRIQRRSFLRDRKHSVPTLIDRVLTLTAPLLPHVPVAQRDRVFLAGNVAGDRSVGLIAPYLLSKHVRLFVKRHGLIGGDGLLLPLTLAGLRVTGLTLAHQMLNGDLIKTQSLANHASLDTTRRYVDQPAVRATQRQELARLQARFVSWVRDATPSSVMQELAVSTEEAVRILSGENATATGFTCRDPMAGMGPSQKKGRLCSAWLGCFTCPNAVIPLEEEALARLIATRDALNEARDHMVPDRWQLLYGPKLEILERDILPRFTAAMHEAALARSPQTYALPPIE
ncbi:MAG: hypothetical protein WBW33_03915, partial [Bryobacteraceae bacterium]